MSPLKRSATGPYWDSNKSPVIASNFYMININNILPLDLRAGTARWYSAGLRAGWPGVREPAWAGYFSSHHRVQSPALGSTQPSIQLVQGALSLGVKRPGREAIPPLPQYAFMARCSVKKAQGRLYLYMMSLSFSYVKMLMIIQKETPLKMT